MMPANRLLRLATATGIVSLLASGAAHATPLADNVRLIAATVQARLAAPSAKTFAVTQAGMYTVRLTDLATPGPLTSLSVAVATSTATVTAPPLIIVPPATAASVDVMLAVGNYTVQPLAVPAAGSGGSFTVVVTPQGGGSPLFTGPWVVPAVAASPPPGQSALNSSFTVTDSGTYQMSVTDRVFPAALSGFQAIVLREPDGMTMCVIASLAAPSCAMTLAAGTTYDVIVLANADVTALAGLCSLKIVGGSSGSSEPYAATIPVGNLPQVLTAQVPAAESVSVQLQDLSYPAALGSLSAVVVQGAEVLQQFGASGTASFVATAGPLQVFALAAPDATGGEGAYALYAHDAANTLADQAVPVVDTTHVGYAYPALLAAAGNYQLVVTDYLLPSPLVALNVLAEQRGQLLGTGVTPVPTLAAQSGTVNMVAFAQATTAGANGLFGIDLVNASGTAVFQTTQGVGASFQTVDVVASAGKYVVQLTDLGFPANFSTVWLIGTWNRRVGTQIVVGQGSSTGRAVFDVPSAGTYVFNVLAQTAAGQQYGLYGFNLAAAPAAPTVTLSSSTSAVNAGGKVTLTWSSTDATSCTASDGWSGMLATTGTQDSSALSATTTFTLTCTGDGGSGSASTQVRVTQPPASGGGGGGGALDSATVLALALAATWSLRRRAGMMAAARRSH
jgi:hypothetical protein